MSCSYHRPFVFFVVVTVFASRLAEPKQQNAEEKKNREEKRKWNEINEMYWRCQMERTTYIAETMISR